MAFPEQPVSEPAVPQLAPQALVEHPALGIWQRANSDYDVDDVPTVVGEAIASIVEVHFEAIEVESRDPLQDGGGRSLRGAARAAQVGVRGPVTLLLLHAA